MIDPASLLHCRHWVFSDFYQYFFFGDVSFSHNLIVKFQPKLGTKRVAAVLTAEVMCASCFFVFISQSFVSVPIYRLGWATLKDWGAAAAIGVRSYLCIYSYCIDEEIVHLTISLKPSIYTRCKCPWIFRSKHPLIRDASLYQSCSFFYIDQPHHPPSFLNIWLKMLGLYEDIC